MPYTTEADFANFNKELAPETRLGVLRDTLKVPQYENKIKMHENNKKI